MEEKRTLIMRSDVSACGQRVGCASTCSRVTLLRSWTNSGLSDGDWAYFDCLRGYLEGNDADWSILAVQGDYYVRDGIVSHDESYGLLSSDWSGLRNPDILSLLSGMMAVTQGP